MSRAKQLTHLFMVMHVKQPEASSLIKELRTIFEVEDDEPDTALVLAIKSACEIVEQAEQINKDLGDISSQISSLRFKL